MKLFAIGDLHLPGGQEKPMDVFGGRWTDHPARIAAAWKERVAPEDWVLVPGDISWAMKLEEAAADLAYIGALPGRVVMIRGNHDYWWQGIGKVRRALPEGVHALQNDFVHIAGDWAVCGTRGWNFPQHPEFGEEDRKLYERELGRLEFSLKASEKAGLRPRIAMLHFPPAPADAQPTGFTELLEAYGVELCVYGHLHGAAARKAIRGEHRGVRYCLAACDAIDFTPVHVGDIDDAGVLYLGRNG